MNSKKKTSGQKLYVKIGKKKMHVKSKIEWKKNKFEVLKKIRSIRQNIKESGAIITELFSLLIV